jgi:ABC-type multidrug transport system fused ATPase/permease subunit
VLVLIYTGAIEVQAGELTQGEVIALYNYMSQILVELIKLANLIISISKALASATRIADVLDLKSSENMGTATEGCDSEFAFELRGASLRYEGSPECALEGISLAARWGETVGIIGGTGSGKSSLVNLIPGFYDATEGEVRIFGKEIHSYSEAGLREKIGVVPQRAVLFRGSIRENLAWGDANASEAEMLRAIDIAQARDVVDEKGGLDAMIEQGGKNLSGGQKQRLTIARAIVGSPRILILDDSASALDYATDAALRRSLREMGGDTTTFVVSQRAASVMHADKILVLDDGECVGLGTHDELLESCSVYREIYDSQFKKEGA